MRRNSGGPRSDAGGWHHEGLGGNPGVLDFGISPNKLVGRGA